MIGGPLGAQIGSGVASAAGQALGLEPKDGGSGENEFEGARQFVRMAADTAQNAVAAAQSGADPRRAAQSAAVAAGAAPRSGAARFANARRGARAGSSVAGAAGAGRANGSATGITSFSTGCDQPCRSAPPPVPAGPGGPHAAHPARPAAAVRDGGADGAGGGTVSQRAVSDRTQH